MDGVKALRRGDMTREEYTHGLPRPERGRIADSRGRTGQGPPYELRLFPLSKRSTDQHAPQAPTGALRPVAH